MNLRQMEVFHAVMRAGSVTGAAKLLNVTQPAVSAVLRHCEDRLKINLFERAGGRLYPTPEAEAIFPDIANVFQRVETISRMATDLAGGRLGNITIAATFAVANGPLAEAISDFSASHPQIKFAVHALPTHQVIDRVARREADFGLGFGPVDDPAIDAETLASAEIACVMPRDHPLANEPFVTPEKLAGHAIITYAPHTPIGSPVEEAFRESGVELIRNVQVNYSVTAFILASQGAGIALVEPILLGRTMTPSLVSRPFRPSVEVKTILMHPVGRPRTRTSSAFIERLKSKFAPGHEMLIAAE